MKKKQDRLFAGLSLCAGIAVFAVIIFFSFPAVRKLAEGYTSIKNADLSQEYTGTIYYDDGYYGVIGFGIANDPGDPAREAVAEEFLVTSLRAIDERITACGLTYMMIIVTILAYFLYAKNRDNGKRHLLDILLSCVLVFGLYLFSMILMCVLRGVPFSLPGGHGLLSAFTGFVSVCAGSCVLAVLLRIVRFKKIVSLLAVPSVIALFMFSFVMEAGLYSPKYTDSFDYVADIDPRLLDENFNDAYYDEEKNVLVVGGTEYLPEQQDNPDYMQGASRIGAYAFEVLDPYSGNSLFLAEQEAAIRTGLKILSLYLLKGIVWIAAGLFFLKGKES